MFFVNPVMNLNATGLFATHPPIEERISRLRRL
jgi:Zn-dependent protease with chaperone function